MIINNINDIYFDQIISYLKDKNTTVDFVLANLINSLDNFKSENLSYYEQLVTYFKTYPIWGTLNPEEQDFNTLYLRAKVLVEHIDDFIWLYNKLSDYLSKKTLNAILTNWLFFDIYSLDQVKQPLPQYFDPDIFSNNIADTFVDCGAYIGDTISEYIQFYGSKYNKIIAYETTPDTFEKLKDNIQQNNYKNCELKQLGVSDKKGTLFLNRNSENCLSNNLSTEGSETINVISLDEDLKNEKEVTFIKMDIEGYEQKALLGAKQIIKRDTPKLAICVYHGYDALCEIPKMIESLNSNYDFYLRHYGGNLFPTEFVLLCKPKINS